MFTTEHDRQAVRSTIPAEDHDPGLNRLQDPACEAPDRGLLDAEPPEDAIIRHAEAPDAGEGRLSLVEQDYTHGRSMT